MELDFEHKHAAHCENGVISNMLNYYGIHLSEPMIFGLASGLFFSHMPFVKLSGMAVTSFRTFPGVLFKRIAKLLNFKIKTKRYFNKEKAITEMEAILSKNIPVGCVVGMYYLPYMPIEYRFHFNGHNICIIGKDEKTSEYIVSDPNATQKVKISRKDLIKVRFAKGGTYPLLGQMYWIEKIPDQTPELKPLILKAIKKNCWLMTSQPKWLKYFGVNGIECLSKQVLKWEKTMTPRKAALNLAQVIRMLEEIGTGGAGFRFMYGAFLQEASKIVDMPELNDFAKEITDIGDLWRKYAYMSARIFKKRDGEQYTYAQLSEILHTIYLKEDNFFRRLNTQISQKI